MVVVTTMYDSIVLDESGTVENNRKATTGLEAKYLSDPTTFTLSYYPTTEGE